jgi:CHASE2 domain-containing sensor protein
MASFSHKRTFLTSFRRAFPAIVLAIAGTYILSRLGTLHGLERLALDAEMAAGPHTSTSICLVEITDMDYDDIFGGRSPLQPDKLHDLINAIALSRPAVIGVDIDTSHPQFRNLKIEPDWPPVIWERDITMNDRIIQESEPLDVLGGQGPRINLSSGIPVLLDDPEDKVTRLYTQCVKTKSDSEPTLVYALAMAYRSAISKTTFDSRHVCGGGTEAPTQPLYINYALKQGATLYEKDATQVLGLSSKKENGGQGQMVPDFLNKIVLIGGTYRDFDRHFTPIGALPGVAVLANAIDTELEGGGVKASPRWVLFGLEFLASALIVLLFHQYAMSPGMAIAWGVPLTVALSLIFSYFSFHTFSRFVNFAPTLLAVLIFEVYEYVRHESILGAVRSTRKPESGDHESKS